MYKVIKDCIIGTTVKDGQLRINKRLSNCTQEELKHIYHELNFISNIEKTHDEEPAEEQRDNDPEKPEPTIEKSKRSKGRTKKKKE